MHVAALEALLSEMTIHLSRAAQVKNESVQVAALKQDKAPTKVPAKYSDFSDVFLAEKTLVLLKQTEFNQHTIKLEESKQLPYGQYTA